jgi:hypothetical protein
VARDKHGHGEFLDGSEQVRLQAVCDGQSSVAVAAGTPNSQPRGPARHLPAAGRTQDNSNCRSASPASSILTERQEPAAAFATRQPWVSVRTFQEVVRAAGKS